MAKLDYLRRLSAALSRSATWRSAVPRNAGEDGISTAASE